jgi:2-polyprenyl-3-methyl-5-hydroxy-6-metoxy-1,4-benzoquinol methylase
MEKRYQDYVIADGKLVGDFENLYKNFEDPWHQSELDHKFDSRRQLAINYTLRLNKEFGIKKVIELGCGFGFTTESLRKLGLNSIGTDISETAIKKAKELHPESKYKVLKFNDFQSLFELEPEVIIMAEITWYVLDDLEEFIKNLKLYSSQINKSFYLIHLLATYAPGVQKYGKDKFTNLDEILKFFNLNYLEYGYIKTVTKFDEDSQGTYFVAKI